MCTQNPAHSRCTLQWGERMNAWMVRRCTQKALEYKAYVSQWFPRQHWEQYTRTAMIPFWGIRRNWCNSKQSTPETTGPAPAGLQLVVTLWPIEARADWGFLYHLGAKASRAYTIDFHLIRHPENSQWEAGLSLHSQPKVRGSPGHTDVGNNTQWLLWPQKEHPVEGQAGQISNMSKKIWPNIFTNTRCSHGGQRI